MPKPRKTTGTYCLTVAELKGEMKRFNKGLNALSREIRKLKAGTRITAPGVPKIKPGPQVGGDDCIEPLWEGKLAIREIGPALKKLSVYLDRIAKYTAAHKLPK